MGFIDEVPTAEKKLSVIEALRTVTEGKVWTPAITLGRVADPHLARFSSRLSVLV